MILGYVRVVMGLFWGCSGVVLGLFYGCFRCVFRCVLGVFYMLLDGFIHEFSTFVEDCLPPSQICSLIILRILRHLNSTYFGIFDKIEFHVFYIFFILFLQGSVAVAVAFK